MSKVKIKKEKMIKTLVISLLILICIVYLLIPAGFGFYSTLKYKKDVGEPLKGFSEIELNTTDGTPLMAWYKSPQNGAVVILLHGATGSRDGIRKYAQMLTEHEYGVLALDMHGHGESGGDGVNGYNWSGSEDVGAAVKYLLQQENVRTIGGLGISLGGEVLLGASGSYKQLKAIVSDGATYRSLEDYLALSANRNLIRSFTTRIMYHAAELFSGVTPPERLVDSIADAKDASFLFIAAGNVQKEIDYNNLFVGASNGKSELWVVKEVGHTRALSEFPDEYENRVIGFFDGKLLNK